MTRSLMLVLLLATGVALADDAPKAKSANSAAEAQKKAKAGAQEKAKAEAQEKATTEAQEKAKAETQEKSKAEEQEKATAGAQATAQGDSSGKDDPNLGMSILGNQEAPKALVIVPWKSSEMGNALGISTLLDDSRQPIDKEVFMRMLSYYDIRSETAPHIGAPAAGRETAPAEGKMAQPASAAHRRKP